MLVGELQELELIQFENFLKMITKHSNKIKGKISLFSLTGKIGALTLAERNGQKRQDLSEVYLCYIYVFKRK